MKGLCGFNVAWYMCVRYVVGCIFFLVELWFWIERLHGFGEITLGCFNWGFQFVDCNSSFKLKDSGFGELQWVVIVGVSSLHITIMVLSFKCFCNLTQSYKFESWNLEGMVWCNYIEWIESNINCLSRFQCRALLEYLCLCAWFVEFWKWILHPPPNLYIKLLRL